MTVPSDNLQGGSHTVVVRIGAHSTPQDAASGIAARARCFDPDGSNTFLFFSDDPMNLARAKAICAKCTVRQPCLTTALRREEAYGVWGGELIVDGRIKADIPRRGRPRKVARILIEVDEITGTPIVA
jgi:WhiB family redox-sensing transcriptional regulator